MTDRAAELRAALGALEERLTAACAAAGRRRDEVTLVAVSKTWPIADVASLAALGVRDFGENRDQEARGKAAARPDLRWHFVGRLQTNKCRPVAAYATLVHTVDRPDVADALAAGAARAARRLPVLVQVSLDLDPARGGCRPAGLTALADLVAARPDLELSGVMAVPPLGADPARAYDELARLALAVRAGHPTAAVLSAGMTADLEPAIVAGATHVRVGTALFGGRAPVGL